MRYPTLASLLSPRKFGSFPRRAALACASLAVSAAAVHATPAQDVLNGVLFPRTISTASAPQLAAAVEKAIETNTNFSAAAYAEAALQPAVLGSVVIYRGDFSISAPLVASSAIAGLFNNSDPTFANDAPAVVDGVLSVNPGTFGQLNINVQAGVLKSSLTQITNEYYSTVLKVPKATLLGTDTAIGTAIAADSTLEALPGAALIHVLQQGVLGIYGSGLPSSKSQALAPQAAAAFVAGLVSNGSVPDSAQGETSATFAVDFLNNSTLYKNATIDELVANKIALQDNNANPTNLVALATALYTNYPGVVSTFPSFETKVTQGIVAAISTSTGETSRGSFIDSLTTAAPFEAVSVVEGATYADPWYSSVFTNAALSTLQSASSPAFSTTATSLSKSLGTILGADGNELTEVAGVFGSFIGSGALSTSNAATYAVNLIKSAAYSTVPTSAFTGAPETQGEPFAFGGGGALNLGNAISTFTFNDLSSIVNQLSGALITASDTNLAGDIGTLTADVAAIVGGSTSNKAAIAIKLVGTLSAYLNTDFGSNASLSAILTTVVTDVNHLVSSASKTSLTAATANYVSYENASLYGAIDNNETPTTNL